MTFNDSDHICVHIQKTQCVLFQLSSSIFHFNHFLNHGFGVFMPFSTMGNHGFIVALKLLLPKKKKSISTFEDEICWFAGRRVRAEVSIEELAHQRDPHRPPPLPHRTKCTMMNFLGAERVLLRIRNFGLTGMGSSGNYSPFSPSCFFNQFCKSVCPFIHFWTWKLGNSNHFPSSSSSNLQGNFFNCEQGASFICVVKELKTSSFLLWSERHWLWNIRSPINAFVLWELGGVRLPGEFKPGLPWTVPWLNFEFSIFSHFIFIGPESDHWLCLSVTHWLTD